MYWLDAAYQAFIAFMDKGGNVLWLIAILLFFMWMLIFERIWYFRNSWVDDSRLITAGWEARSERRSWEAKQIREKLISDGKNLLSLIILPLVYKFSLNLLQFAAFCF